MADTGEQGADVSTAEAAQSVAAKAEPKSRAVSCVALPSFSEACGLVDSPYSCLVVETHRRHLALPPRFLSKKRSGIQEQLTRELLRYSSRLQGVPVAYDNIKIVGELGDIHDDLGFIHLTIQADFVIFQPQHRQKLLGVVNKVAPSHIGCLVHGCFNASIPKPYKMPIEVWQHIGVKIGDHMEFEVSRLDSDAVGVFCIRGWLDEKIEAEALQKLNEVAKENDPEMSSDNTAKTPEDADKEAANETVEIPEDTPKRKAKKRHIQETMPENVTGTSEGWSEPSASLEEFPKKKKKKKLQKLNSQADTVEVDAYIENSSVGNSIVQSLRVDNISKKAEKKGEPEDSLPSIETGGHIQTKKTILSRFDNESFVPCSEEGPKKSKKKKRKSHSEACLDQSLQITVLEDSALTENNKTSLPCSDTHGHMQTEESTLSRFNNESFVPCSDKGPKKSKKRKRKSHSEACLDQSLQSTILEDSALTESNKTSLPCSDTHGRMQTEECILSRLDNESLVPCSEERPKKSKKKKLKSLQNGVLEDSALTENNVLESFGANSETVPEDTTRKRKKHKRLSEVLDPPLKSACGEASSISEEAQLAKLIKQETPKQKKHKKRHHNVSPMSDNGAAQAEDSIIVAGQEFVEPKAKKKQKK